MRYFNYCPSRFNFYYLSKNTTILLKLLSITESQLTRFQLLEKGSKLLYLNTVVRGYPQGLRAGSNPREPIITVDGGFEKMEYKKIPFYIETIEVWGCGDHVQREKQLEVKKWEIKEAEKQRTVKLSAADWLDHPDR